MSRLRRTLSQLYLYNLVCSISELLLPLYLLWPSTTVRLMGLDASRLEKRMAIIARDQIICECRRLYIFAFDGGHNNVNRIRHKVLQMSE